jgi:hypothetical protein
MRGKQVIEGDLFHRGIPRTVRDTQLPRRALRERAAGAEPRCLACSCRRHLDGGYHVGVLEIVGVIRRDGIGVRHPARPRHEQPRDAAGAPAAALGGVETRRGRIEGDEEKASEGLEGGHVRGQLPAGEGIATH